ncbi:hypothetical protein ACNKHW_04775 [Shigella flexneri]
MATVQVIIVLAIGIWAYQIPSPSRCAVLLHHGDIRLSLVGIGLSISPLSATQQQAFIGVFVLTMPARLLSGQVARWKRCRYGYNTYPDQPYRHFKEITKQIYLKDASWIFVWKQVCGRYWR